MNKLSTFATVDPNNGMNKNTPARCQNLVSGEWKDDDNEYTKIPDPLNGDDFILVPNTTDATEFIENLRNCPKSGLHNPIKNVDRYVMLGDVCAKSAELMRDPEIELFFAKLIQRVMPKSINQCLGEVRVTRIFLENFAGDGVRFLARGFSNPGDHDGQESKGYRWPFGPVVLIAPFNFPLEIPVLQFMGALFMGNRPLVKSDSKVSIVFEQFLRMAIHCGLPASDSDFIHCDGKNMDQLITDGKEYIRHLQFTGSSDV
ncbi:MAG: aldehyde dehydrogenase family protein, partial [Pseudomonadota bacterium]|nr:aldehyde dehydrogenase family protein [Pseudomonadota bacterium]